MHAASLTPTRSAPATDPAGRRGDAAALDAALQASRADTLRSFAAYERALPQLQVPLREELNPPLWELGHIGWFQEFWLDRFSARDDGWRADPDAPRRPGVRAGADALYHSSRVAHDSRWQLPLPDAAATRADLAAQLERTLELLHAPSRDAQRYFHRLALLHEDMHHEAALYMAQALGVPVDDPRWQAAPLPAPPPPLRLAATRWRLGSDPAAGFAFDNELQPHELELDAIEIDAQVLRWAEYLPFADAGGYRDPRLWSDEGWRWRSQTDAQAPRYLRRDGDSWLQWRHGRWRELDLREPACHLSAYEAQAWCRYAGRRLPTEAEWERAVLASAAQPAAALRWGDAWEWTATAFGPYPGFVAHPYRDYSQPWFDGRPVLRGASFMTQPRLRDPHYRNYFRPYRNDVPAGLRSCAR